MVLTVRGIPELILHPSTCDYFRRMADNRTISQLETEGYPWIECECCKGTVWVPFRMLRERIPMLSAVTLDQLGAKMRCDKCGKRPERYYPANQSDTPWVRSNLLMPWSRRFDEPIQSPKGKKLVTLKDAATCGRHLRAG
jgi:hypothetical protein